MLVYGIVRSALIAITSGPAPAAMSAYTVVTAGTFIGRFSPVIANLAGLFPIATIADSVCFVPISREKSITLKIAR